MAASGPGHTKQAGATPGASKKVETSVSTVPGPAMWMSVALGNNSDGMTGGREQRGLKTG